MFIILFNEPIYKLLEAMKKLLALIITTIIICGSVQAQEIQFYTTEEGDKHIWGEFPVKYLEEDTTYSRWYNDSYEAFQLEKTDYEWVKNLEDDTVEIYLGTWCGDSQEWVPQFLKLWDELGLDRGQLKFIALHGSGEDYKQGPKGEEEGLNIHRVPTFIFREDGKEYARIVESPSTDLLTDVAQIALGYPSAPNYAAATYLLHLFDTMSMDEIYKDLNNIYRTGYYKVGRFAELNTLGRVLSAADKKQEALLVFQFNTYYYPSNWWTHKSYAELLAELERYPEAITEYEKVVSLNPESKEAKAELERLHKLNAPQEAEE
jgi:tetratricopeptide (TPR) repeat protein